MTPARSVRSVLPALLVVTLAACGDAPRVSLRLLVVDEATGEPSPARLELRDAEGRAYVAADALAVGGDCSGLALPPSLAAELLALTRSRAVENPYTGTRQFYCEGRCRVSLPPGRYRLRAFKGLEYAVTSRELEVGAAPASELRVPLRRWVDLPASGWYGADDHLHIPRPEPKADRFVAAWMRAEDLHVANLLQMGFAGSPDLTLQYAHGPEGRVQHGATVLASGQENPRTPLLGHVILLGTREPIHRKEGYLLYDLFFEEAEGQGAVAGFAHAAHYAGGRDGLALALPDDAVRFVEVIGAGAARYASWYDALAVGRRLAPTAGTDFPCGAPSLPGRERFYARVEGDLGFDAWLEAVRAGRTFATNGPILSLRVGGAGIGSVLRLDAPGPVEVAGRARVDVERDALRVVEVVEAGRVIRSFTPPAGGDLRFRFQHDVRGPTWLALRAFGEKRGETTRGGAPRGSFAHTAPIWLELAGAAAGGPSLAAREAARRWRDRLAAVEDRLRKRRVETLPWWSYRSDRIGAERVERDRAALLQRIGRARAWYEVPHP